MTLFDGSRWDRLRRSALTIGRVPGPIRPYAGLNCWEIPLPRLSFYFELQTIQLGLDIGDALNDSLLSIGIEVTLPAWAANLADRLLP